MMDGVLRTSIFAPWVYAHKIDTRKVSKLERAWTGEDGWIYSIENRDRSSFAAACMARVLINPPCLRKEEEIRNKLSATLIDLSLIHISEPTRH